MAALMVTSPVPQFHRYALQLRSLRRFRPQRGASIGADRRLASLAAFLLGSARALLDNYRAYSLESMTLLPTSRLQFLASSLGVFCSRLGIQREMDDVIGS